LPGRSAERGKHNQRTDLAASYEFVVTPDRTSSQISLIAGMPRLVVAHEKSLLVTENG
jgi:hypothetical protein